MKTKSLLLIFTIIFCYKISNSQEDQTFNFDENHLIGNWVYQKEPKHKRIVFIKQDQKTTRYNSSTEILKGGKFRSRYSSWCGNDSRLFSDNYIGEWNLDKKTSTLTMINPSNQKKRKYKIVELTSEKLVVIKLKSFHPEVKRALDEIINNN